MPTATGYTRSPRLAPGALIQLTKGVIGIIPSITLFQYNPEEISRSFEISMNPSRGKGTVSPLSQHYPPDETINFTLELDATDDLERRRPLTIAFGVSDRIAVLEKMIFPSGGLFTDVLEDVAILKDKDGKIPVRRAVSVVLLALGPGRVVPVRITSMSVTEIHHSPLYMPIHAKVTLGMRIISEEEFRPGVDVGLDIKFAQACYRVYRTQRDVLAVAHIASAVRDTIITVT